MRHDARDNEVLDELVHNGAGRGTTPVSVTALTNVARRVGIPLGQAADHDYVGMAVRALQRAGFPVVFDGASTTPAFSDANNSLVGDAPTLSLPHGLDGHTGRRA